MRQNMRQICTEGTKDINNFQKILKQFKVTVYAEQYATCTSRKHAKNTMIAYCMLHICI